MGIAVLFSASAFSFFGVSLPALITAISMIGGALVFGYRVGLTRRKEQVLDAQIHLNDCVKENSILRPKVERLDLALQRSSDGRGVWDLEHLRAPSWYARRLAQSPATILTVANLKGGVGKTTLAANLGVYFARDRGKRVLLVDLDFQGSLTGLCAAAAKLEQEPEPQVHRVIKNEVVAGHETRLLTDPLARLSGLRLLASGYGLAVEEDRLLIENLLAAEEKFGLFALARFLASDKIAEEFDMVILDASPRLSAATLNAMFACNAYIMPVKPSPVSNRSVAYFESEINSSIRPINRDARLIGIALTLTVGAGEEGPQDEPFVDEIRENFSGGRERYTALREAYPDGPPFLNTRIPNLAAIGRGIAILDGDQRSKTYLTTFCQEVEERLGNT